MTNNISIYSTNNKKTEININLLITISYNNGDIICSYVYDIIKKSTYINDKQQNVPYATKKNNNINIFIPKTFGFLSNDFKSNYNQNIFYKDVYKDIYKDYVYECNNSSENKMIITFDYYPEQELIDNYFLIIIEFISFVLSLVCDKCIDNNSIANVKPFKFDLFNDKNFPMPHFAWSCLKTTDAELLIYMLSKPLSINFYKNTIQPIFDINNKSNKKINDITQSGLLLIPFIGQNIKITSIFGYKDNTLSIISNDGIHSFLTNMLNPLQKYPSFNKESFSRISNNPTTNNPANIINLFDIAQQIDPI
jgi:hypothetical protein